MNRPFPKDFLWGVATSAAQIEGGAWADGKGESIWDRFCRIPGKVKNGDRLDVACDHYHLFSQDVRLLKELQVNTYRFSVSWPRIFPAGAGSPNQKGLDFYKRLIEACLENGIQPSLTIYHWDLPQALQDKGGWVNRDMVDYFLEYALTLFRELGDVVSMWTTHNEPWVISYLGYGNGIHAPGYANVPLFLKVAHHLLLSHGKTVKAFRNDGPKDGKVGLTLNMSPCYPVDEQAENKQAARIYDGFLNRWFIDPVVKGAYPQDMTALYERTLPIPFDYIQEEDMQMINEPIDFIGINYYSPTTLRADPLADGPFPFLGVEPVATSGPVTDMGEGWEINPDGLKDLLLRLHRDYQGLPIYVHENGAAYDDQVEADGSIQDRKRIQYLRSHILACQEALQAGVPLKGYYVWSLMDNFEWAFGYDKRFGIVHVDFETLKRTPKQSFYWYRQLIRQQGVVPDISI
ncbi:GH1 family beta-glucosidase [Laceyella putida]|uniref:Beta-glucosidase n=1 Tax=Laceyella putida TaxID=110101 RepID=A0ABW2RKK6_9BACL